MKPVLLCVALLCLLSLIFANPPAHAQGKLKKFEKEVKNESSKSDDRDDEKGNKSSKGDNHGGHHDDEFWWVEVIYDIASSTHIGPFFKGLISGAWPTEWQNHNPYFWTASYAPYPYAFPRKGRFLHTGGKRSAVSMTGHYFHESKALHGYSLWSRFSASPFLNIETHITGLTEALGTDNDYLVFYDVYVNYQRVRHENVVFWYGAGIKSMQGDDRYYGPAMTTGLEIYPGRPVSLYGMINIGRLNAQAVWETQLRMNLHLNRALFYAGFQRFSVGRVAINGFVFGAGMYF